MRNINFILSQIDARPYFCPVRRAIARHHDLPAYKDYCDAHGVTPHRTETATCNLCVAPPSPGAPRSDRPRAVARREGRPHFLAACVTHGETDHHTQNGKCASCFTTAGIRRSVRADVNPARVEARRSGAYEYLDECLTHGQTKHHVQTGKCLICFNAMGYPRP